MPTEADPRVREQAGATEKLGNHQISIAPVTK